MSEVTPQSITKDIKSLRKIRNNIAQCSAKLGEILEDYNRCSKYLDDQRLCEQVFRNVQLDDFVLVLFKSYPAEEQTFKKLVALVSAKAEVARFRELEKNKENDMDKGKGKKKKNDVNSNDHDDISIGSIRATSTGLEDLANSSDSDGIESDGEFDPDLGLDRLQPQFSGQYVKRNMDEIVSKLPRNDYIEMQSLQNSFAVPIDTKNRIIMATGSPANAFCNRNLFHELTIFKEPIQYNTNEAHPIYAFGFGTFLLTISGRAYKCEAWFVPLQPFNIFNPSYMDLEYSGWHRGNGYLGEPGDIENGIPLDNHTRAIFKMRVQPDKYSEKIFTKKLENWKKKNNR